ncbi:hypothetical protein [Agromyces lapidis]|uniref:XRE family transcriptional regulator n=1 Tax=Agromyces lapidis TaxID=279574 RepID=A0ABV5SMC7_9MICO|nr:hypothetical protein [Agromyces lapidis]
MNTMTARELAQKLANPNMFTVGELAAIARIFSVSPADLLAVV